MNKRPRVVDFFLCVVDLLKRGGNTSCLVYFGTFDMPGQGGLERDNKNCNKEEIEERCLCIREVTPANE